MSEQQQPSPPQVMLPTNVPPSPVPTSIDLTIIQNPAGSNIVAMRIDQPTGVTVAFCEPDWLINFGEQCKNIGGQAKTGIIRPTVPRLVHP